MSFDYSLQISTMDTVSRRSIPEFGCIWDSESLFSSDCNAVDRAPKRSLQNSGIGASLTLVCHRLPYQPDGLRLYDKFTPLALRTAVAVLQRFVALEFSNWPVRNKLVSKKSRRATPSSSKQRSNIVRVCVNVGTVFRACVTPAERKLGHVATRSY